MFDPEFLSAALPHTKIVGSILNLEIEMRILKTLKILFSLQHRDVFQLFHNFLVAGAVFHYGLVINRVGWSSTLGYDSLALAVSNCSTRRIKAGYFFSH